MKSLPNEVYAGVLSTLRSYQYGNAAPDLAESMADKMVDEVMDVPEGCTPADARNLRNATFGLATQVHELKALLQSCLNAFAFYKNNYPDVAQDDAVLFAKIENAIKEPVDDPLE